MRRTIIVVLALGAMGVGCSHPRPTHVRADAGATIDVDMSDNHFSLDEVDVPVGATVTFRFRNVGAVGHEALIGDEATQLRQEREHGSGVADENRNAVVVGRRETKTLTHTFDAAGVQLVGCHQPRHYAQGMKFVVKVQ